MRRWSKRITRAILVFTIIGLLLLDVCTSGVGASLSRLHARHTSTRHARHMRVQSVPSLRKRVAVVNAGQSALTNLISFPKGTVPCLNLFVWVNSRCTTRHAQTSFTQSSILALSQKASFALGVKQAVLSQLYRFPAEGGNGAGMPSKGSSVQGPLIVLYTCLLDMVAQQLQT